MQTVAITNDPLHLPLLAEKGCSASVLRLDNVHPVISGNKWFKLKYYLQKAVVEKKQQLLTFGGAYSNHIIATACAAKESGFSSVGIIRGERPVILSPTLLAAESYGMQLKFISREEYKRKNDPVFLHLLLQKFDDTLIIPEGGFGLEGIRGSAEILSLIPKEEYTHILCAGGTGTMYSGLVNAAASHQTVLGICVLKGMNDMDEQLQKWAIDKNARAKHKIIYGYHFGGYAKKENTLITFMNTFYRQTSIPTDFVYTGKLVYATMDMLKNNHFPAGSKLLVIHSGGLQGNNSLPNGTLIF